MFYGFGMESKLDGDKDIQPQLLKKAGADRIYIERAFKPKEHTQFTELTAKLKAGDTLITWKLSRMAYSFKDLSNKIKTLCEKNVTLICVVENMKFDQIKLSFMSKMLVTLVQNDASVMRERTIAGLDAARAMGRKGGRKASISNVILEKTKLAYSMSLKGDARTLREILCSLKLSAANYYRYLKMINHKQENLLKSQRQNTAKEK